MFILYDTNRNILFEKLNWQKSLSFNCESSIKSHIKCYFEEKFNKKLEGVLNTNSVFMFENKFKSNLNKFFSTSFNQLKNKFKKETQKFENLFDLVSSIKNLRKAYNEIKNKLNSLNLHNVYEKVLKKLEFN